MTFIYPSDVSLLKDAFFDPLDYIRSLRHALKHSAPYHCNTVIMWFLLDYCWIMYSISGLFSLSCSSVKARPMSVPGTIVFPVLSTETDTGQALSLFYIKEWINVEWDITLVFREVKSGWGGDKPAGVVWWVLGGSHTVLEKPQKQRPLSQCECPGKHSAGI